MRYLSMLIVWGVDAICRFYCLGWWKYQHTVPLTFSSTGQYNIVCIIIVVDTLSLKTDHVLLLHLYIQDRQETSPRFNVDVGGHILSHMVTGRLEW